MALPARIPGTAVEVEAVDLETSPQPEPAIEGTWPHALSQEPLLRVSDVLEVIGRQFPALTSSKLRFLDSQGLVCPFRTPGGYRLYSPADVERLKFVLRHQRDHYRPLNVIRDMLDSLDSGRLHEPVTVAEIAAAPDDYLSGEELAARGGVSGATLADLEAAGIVAPSVPDGYLPTHLDVVVAARAYLEAGGDVRAVRTLVLAARRESDRARQAAAPVKDVGAAQAARSDFGEAAIAVFSAVVRTGVEH